MTAIIALLSGVIVVTAAFALCWRWEAKHWQEIVARRDAEIKRLEEQLPFKENRKG